MVSYVKIPNLVTMGIQMVCGFGIILSGYEKPICLQKYLDLYKMYPKHILFVDDFG